MRKLIITNFMSLDGFYEGPRNNVMALPLDDAFGEYNLERLRAADTVLLGGNSYEMFKGFWPFVKDDSSFSALNREFSRVYNKTEKMVVADRAITLEKGHPWSESTQIIRRADAHSQIDKLRKGEGKDIVMFGSRTLWGDLLIHGLVDELHLMIGAVLLGAGTPIFKGHPATLRRLDTRTFDGSDNVLVRYEVLGTKI